MSDEYHIPRDEAPARCPYCDRPFRTPDVRALHIGERHPDRATDDEQSAYDAARDAESDAMFIFHLKVIAALILTYMGFAYLWVFVLT